MQKRVSFYKRNGYYKMKGNRHIEFCCPKFDAITGNRKSRFEVLIRDRPARQYARVRPDLLGRIYLDDKYYHAWLYVCDELIRQFGTTFYIKLA